MESNVQKSPTLYHSIHSCSLGYFKVTEKGTCIISALWWMIITYADLVRTFKIYIIKVVHE